MAQSEDRGGGVSRRQFVKTVSAGSLAVGVLTTTLAETHAAAPQALGANQATSQRKGVPDAAEIKALGLTGEAQATASAAYRAKLDALKAAA